jgi:hypothetical protein
MKIDDPKKSKQVGALLNSFALGDCIRLVSDGGSTSSLGYVYIVAGVGDADRLAINLSDGYRRDEGLFVLEPHAKVVIE